MDSEDVLYTANFLYPYLSDLLGNDASDVRDQLDELLIRNEAGEKVDNLILDLLTQYKPTKYWMRAALIGDQNSTRLQGLSGQPGPIKASVKYKCPEPDCDCVWIVRKTGRPIPTCPRHNRLLERVEKA